MVEAVLQIQWASFPRLSFHTFYFLRFKTGTLVTAGSTEVFFSLWPDGNCTQNLLHISIVL